MAEFPLEKNQPTRGIQGSAAHFMVANNQSENVGAHVDDRSAVLLPLAFLIATAYLAARFFTGKAALPLLGVFGLVILLIVLERAKNTLTWRQVALLLPIALVAIERMFSGDEISAIYYVFELVFLIGVTSARDVGKTISVGITQSATIFHLLLVLAFLLFPGLEGLTKISLSEGEIESIALLGEERSGIKAYLYNIAELGQLSSALLLLNVSILMSSTRIEIKRLSAILISALAYVVYLSDSSTSLLHAIACIGLILIRPQHVRPISFLLAIAAGALALSQVLFAASISDYLVTGSMFWRFRTAEEIYSGASIFNFGAPGLSSLSNWPHSLGLDIIFSFGKIGFAIYFILLAGYIIQLTDRGRYLVGVCLICGLLNPPGGGLSLPLLALAIAAITESSQVRKSRHA